MSEQPAYVFVIGHGMSGIGKGTIASSLGLLLRGHGFRVSAVKLDPYLNCDAGTMSPHEHGEVYVLGDGAECDLDLGNYERFMGIQLTGRHNVTTGQVYREVIERERAGEYLGQTVQVEPHVIDHIRARIVEAAHIPVDGSERPPELVIVELGGTVGDIESEAYLMALSGFARATGAKTCFVSVGAVVDNAGEEKTKPLQHSMRELRARGIQPDVLCVRTQRAAIAADTRAKLAARCNVASGHIVVCGKVPNVYHVPDSLHQQRMPELVCRKLELLWRGTLVPDFTGYQRILRFFAREHSQRAVEVAIVAKYHEKVDTYLSLTRALEHAAFQLQRPVRWTFVDAEALETEQPPILAERFDCVLVPGGFGVRGVAGKREAIRQARCAGIPFLGICLGMQLMVIEAHRNVAGLPRADSVEFDPECDPQIVQSIQAVVPGYGASMRLGNQRVRLAPGSLAYTLYNASAADRQVVERHRHRYEIASPAHATGHGLRVAGVASDNDQLVEIVESADPARWWAIASQFHPEYSSRNNQPHPLFAGFLAAAAGGAK